LLRLLAAIAAAPADPVPLAALLQHPLASLGHNPASAQKMHVTTVRVLREHDPVPRALHARIAVLTDKHVRSEHPRTQSALQVAVTILSRVSQALGQGQGEARDLLADEPANAAQWGARLRASFLAFIAGGDSRGWTRMEEEAIAGALDLLAAEGATSEPLAPADLPGLVDALLERRVRLGEDHPRLAIWSPLEARLQTHDLMILGGLTEDTWPEAARREPVLSRRMRARLGLTSPDQDRGLAAHDFFQFASLPRVVLTWCRRCKGRPAVMSGWLRRIETLATAIERDDLFRPAPDADPLALARRLDRPPGPPRPERAPAPKPPVEQRPRRFSASRVSTLIRDPFSIYARDILRIPSVGSFLRQPDVRETGTAVHSALEDWTHAGNFDALDDLEHRIAGQLASLGFPPMDVSERLSRMRPALVTIAARMRDDAREGWTFETEKSFERKIVVEGVEFTLSGVADRVDTFGGQFRIWDYKSGTPPTSNEVISGLEPQLPILGWLQRQQMGGTAPCAVIGYVHVGKPGRNKDTIQPVRRKGDKNQSAVDGPELLDRIEQDLMKVLAAYLDPNQPYLSKPRAKFANKYGDYDHLARRGEWAAGVSEDDDGGGGE
jgi:ATP-dependent helicase/nuclease subunit B